MHILIYLLHQLYGSSYLRFPKERDILLHFVEYHEESWECLVICYVPAHARQEYLEVVGEGGFVHGVVGSGEEVVDVFGEFGVFLEGTVHVELPGIQERDYLVVDYVLMLCEEDYVVEVLRFEEVSDTILRDVLVTMLVNFP